MWPSMVTHTRNLCFAFNPPKEHTHTHTHTVNTHWEQWAAIYAATPGSSCGFGALPRPPPPPPPHPPPPIHLDYSVAFRPRLTTNVLPVLNGKVPKQHGPATLPCVWSYLFLKSTMFKCLTTVKLADQFRWKYSGDRFQVSFFFASKTQKSLLFLVLTINT